LKTTIQPDSLWPGNVQAK